jgi:hypothetical protein
MIGGIIVLTLFLTALAGMVFISQQYDSYQTIINKMSQKDVDRLSENLGANYPGLSGPTDVTGCGGGTCHQYNLTISNLGGIGTQIVRVYINTTDSMGIPRLYILDPTPNPTPLRFRSTDAFLNAGEVSHSVLLWLPNTVVLSTTTAAANTVSLVTSRGRTFSFQWPYPPAGAAVPTGSTLDVGPIRIVFDPNLVTYTTSTRTNPGPAGCANTDPSPTPCIPGGWKFPMGTPIVFYIRLSNIGGSDVTLLDRSAIVAKPLSGTQGADAYFFVVGPMSTQPVVGCHDSYFLASYTHPSWPATGANCPAPPSSIAGYNATFPSPVCTLGNPCYVLPQGPALGQPGQEVYVLFSANSPKGTVSNLLTPGSSYSNYVVFLALFYTYQGYQYGITVPLIAVYA